MHSASDVEISTEFPLFVRPTSSSVPATPSPLPAAVVTSESFPSLLSPFPSANAQFKQTLSPSLGHSLRCRALEALPVSNGTSMDGGASPYCPSVVQQSCITRSQYGSYGFTAGSPAERMRKSASLEFLDSSLSTPDQVTYQPLLLYETESGSSNACNNKDSPSSPDEPSAPFLSFNSKGSRYAV